MRDECYAKCSNGTLKFNKTAYLSQLLAMIVKTDIPPQTEVLIEILL